MRVAHARSRAQHGPVVLPPGGAKRRIAALFRPWPGIALIKEE
jgi:hypothetical protein